MSAIADFIRLPTSKVEHLRSHYEETLEDGHPVAEYDWSGYVIGTLLSYLSERGLELGGSSYAPLMTELSQAHGTSLLILTPAERDAYLDQLAPEHFSANDLQAFYNDFNDCAEGPEIGQAMLDGVSALRQSLASLDDDSVVVCTIG